MIPNDAIQPREKGVAMSNTTMSGPINRRSSGCTPPPGWRGALACNRLRIDPSDGSPVVDYRIKDGRVERRTVLLGALANTVIGGQWERLTPDQLTSQVLASTVVARWLARRLGVHLLIRACNEPSFDAPEISGLSERRRCFSNLGIARAESSSERFLLP